MNQNFKNLEDGMNIARNTNYPLLEKGVDTEWQCWTNVHYSCRKCLEKEAYLHQYLKKILKLKFARDWKEILAISTDFGKKQSSNSFVAKTAKRSSAAKKDLHIINLTNFDLTEKTKLFINWSLCSHFEDLWVNSKKFCFKEHGPVIVVTHQ